MTHHSTTYTVESVTSGHPDKVCDQISDAVLDACLAQDPRSRVAVESFGAHGLLVVAGEVSTKADFDPAAIAKKVYRDIGYENELEIVTRVVRQSPDIAQGVDTGGAGDQGCVKKGTLVRTARGFIPIEDVLPGDFVVTPSGLKIVKHAQMTGVRKIVEIAFANGFSLECTAEHKVLCYRRDGNTYWKEAEKLKEGEFVCSLKPSNMFGKDYVISRAKRSQFFGKYNHKIYGPEEVVLDEETGYIIGELIGDGCVTSKRFIEISFGNNRHHALRVKEILDRKFPKQCRIISVPGSISLKIDSLVVRKHFYNFGIGYAKAPQKTTPNSIFLSPAEVIGAYLSGLFDSDGTIVANTGRSGKNIRIRLCSSSLKLLQETQLLLNDLGIKSSILFNRPKGTPVGRGGGKYFSKHDNYVLSLSGFASYQNFAILVGFRDAKKAERLTCYLQENTAKPLNSRGIYLMPHLVRAEMIDEERLRQELPFAITVVGKHHRSGESEVYDLEIEDVNMFSAGGIFVHNSMYGYATSETLEFLPKAVVLAHALARGLEKLRRNDPRFSWVKPDGKTQVTVDDGTVKTVLVSTQHDAAASPEFIRDQLIKYLIDPIVNESVSVSVKSPLSPGLPPASDFGRAGRRAGASVRDVLVNPTGRFVQGGFDADTGLTGRKIMVDTYGGLIPHGGGCFSGKDPTKVDRSAAYMARFAAKNIVANGFAKECLVSVAYAIGKAEPLMVEAVNERGESIAGVVKKNFDFRPAAIMERLNLRRPIYLQTAAYGHFGKAGLPWEEVVKI